MVEAFEILLLTMLSAVLKCEWGLTEVEEATLTSVSVQECVHVYIMVKF